MSITQERILELFQYNPETGEFYWSVQLGNYIKPGAKAGTTDSSGYQRIVLDRKPYAGHRLAWLYVYGCFPKGCIDHIDGDRSNNSIANLREVTYSENNQNRRLAPKNSTSGLLGVSWNAQSKKWIASIMNKGKRHYLGLYETKESASDAYMEAKLKMHCFGLSRP